MIIARANPKPGEAGPKEIIILGIIQENIVALLGAQPIVVTRATHGDGVPEGWQIVIAYAKTNEELTASLRPAVTADTKVFAMPRSKPTKP